MTLEGKNTEPHMGGNHHCKSCGQRLPLNPTTKQAIVAMYLRGYTQEVIALQFGVSQSFVSKTIKGHVG